MYIISQNKNLNIMFYLWEEGVPRRDYKIVKHLLYTYPEEDLLIIKQDWEVIVNKIIDEFNPIALIIFTTS